MGMRAALRVAVLLAAAAPAAVAGEDPAPPAPASDRALPHHPGAIAWEKDLAAAMEAAGKDGRPVALYFTFDT